MGSVRRLRAQGSLALCGLAVWACNGIVGIEKLHEEPNPKAGGSGGMAGSSSGKGGSSSGGVSNNGGSKSMAGNAGTNPGTGGTSATSGGALGSGGTPGIEGGAGGFDGGAAGAPAQGGTSVGTGGAATGGTTAGGTTSTGGKNAGGTAGSGTGGTNTGPGTVAGVVIDMWGHPLPNVPVTIGTASTVTNTQGKFSITNVAATYDVVMTVRPPVGGGMGNYAWIYQGLTRRDPTLQVYRGLQDQSADPKLQPTGVTAGNTNILAFGSADGSSHRSFTGALQPLGGFAWYGPTATAGAYHILSWKKDTNGYPTAYTSYLTSAINVTANTAPDVPFALTANISATATVTGTVTSPTSASRSNYLYARFQNNSVIPLASVTPTTAAFNFLVPQVTGAEFMVAASEGSDDWYGPYAVAHKPATPGAAVSLAIPTPPTGVAPASGRTGVDGTTSFQWAGYDGPVVLHVESNVRYQGMYIVTAAKNLTLPDVGGGFFLVKNEVHWWQIEVHGARTTVDTYARPGGFIDSFGRGRTEPEFYRADDSSFLAVSQALGFTTTP
ncbi:MAG: hypothetical protein ACOY0T_21745 [Myxococcota bacterium]